MAGQPTPRRAVVYGAVLCGCLLALLGAPPTAAVVPPDGGRGAAAATSGDPGDCGSGGARTAVVADGTYTAVLDRIEDDLAVLEVSDDEGDTHELVVDVAALPADGRQPDAVFEVRVTDGELREATYDESRSESRREAAQDRFDRLTSQPDADENEDEDGE